jgi:hypothetical protein
MNRRAIQPHPSPSQPADVSKLTLILEYDGASRTTYVRGKDGRLYREADVAATEARAERGDAVARAALIVVDFAVDDQGVPRTEDDTFAAMIANREVWERGEFDHLVQIAELFAPAAGYQHGLATKIQALRKLRGRESTGHAKVPLT